MSDRFRRQAVQRVPVTTMMQVKGTDGRSVYVAPQEAMQQMGRQLQKQAFAKDIVSFAGCWVTYLKRWPWETVLVTSLAAALVCPPLHWKPLRTRKSR